MLRQNTRNTDSHHKGLFELVLELALPRNRGGELDIPAWLDGHAKTGSASALTHLAQLHLGNAVTGQALTEALKLLQEAAQKGYPPAQLRIGVLLALGITGVADPEAALPWLKQAVDHNLVEAATMLGMLFATGDGVGKDIDMAEALFQKAAAGGEATAIQWLSDGLPVVKPLVSKLLMGMLRVMVGAMRQLSDDSGDAEMIAALVSASKEGNADASLLLGIIYTEGKLVEPDPQTADFWFALATEQGNLLAALVQNPLTDVPEDITKAPEVGIRVLNLLAQEGDKNMQFLLAVFHRMREDQEPDLAEAVKWLRAASEQGHAEASFLLAGALTNGEGVAQDEEEAERWFSVAAEQGNMRASYVLARALDRKGDHDAAAKRMQIAAEGGHPSAQAVLAFWYAMGSGVDQDKEKATYWARAAQASDPEIFSKVFPRKIEG